MESLVAAKGSLESAMVTLSNSVTDSKRLGPENDTLRASMVALLHAMIDILDPDHEFGEGAPDHEDEDNAEEHDEQIDGSQVMYY
jgi:hypothetical protein